MRCKAWIYGFMLAAACGQAAAQQYTWAPTDQKELWKPGNEAARADVRQLEPLDGAACEGLRLQLQKKDSLKKNATWTFSREAAFFDGIDQADLLLNVYVPDVKQLVQDGTALTVKMGTDGDHCYAYTFYAPAMKRGKQQTLETGWNRLRIPLAKAKGKTGAIDWHQLTFLQVVLWLPQGDRTIEIALGGGVKLEHPNAPNVVSYDVTYDRSTVLYIPGETVAVRLTGTPALPREEAETLELRVVDYEDQVCRTFPVTIPAGAATFTQEISLEAKRFGTYRLELADPDGKTIVRNMRALAQFTVDHDLSDFEVDSFDQTFWGICAHLHGFGADAERHQQMIDLARRMGVRTVRFDLLWRMVEPEPGQWDWSTSDAIAHALKKYNMQGLPGLRYTPGWISTYDASAPDNIGYPNEPYHHPPKTLGPWTNYVSKAVARYQDQFKVWEIWNEPNWLGWHGSAEDFLAELKAGSEAIRATDPEAQVMLAGLAGAPYRDKNYTPEKAEWFWARVTTNFCPVVLGQGKDLFDEMGWHIYYNGDLPEMERDMWTQMNADAVASGVQDKPKWNGECGSDNGYLGTDAGRPMALIRLAAWTRATGFKNFMWYKLWKGMQGKDRHGVLPYWADDNLILGDSELVAYQTCVMNLSGTFFEERVGGSDGVDGFLFAKKDGGKMLVVWRMGETAAWVPDSSWGTVSEIQDAQGNPVSVSSSIELGELPLFIHFK